MSNYQLRQPANQKEAERRIINDRISQLSGKLWSLSGDDYNRCKLTIDYNKRLLVNPTATVQLNACR